MNKQLAALKALLEECLKKCKRAGESDRHQPTDDRRTTNRTDDTPDNTRPMPKVREAPIQVQAHTIKIRIVWRRGTDRSKHTSWRPLSDRIREERLQEGSNTLRAADNDAHHDTSTDDNDDHHYRHHNPTPQSCDEICSSRSMSPQKRDWSSTILSYLNSNGVCSKSASIDFGSYLMIGSCTCYPTSQPSIQISSEKLVCNTQCGTVPCGSKTSCSCGDNCRLDVECRWGGWRQVSERAFVPTAGAVS